jgi:hypothetical protein
VLLLICGRGYHLSILCCVDILYHGFLSGLVSTGIQRMYQSLEMFQTMEVCVRVVILCAICIVVW